MTTVLTSMATPTPTPTPAPPTTTLPASTARPVGATGPATGSGDASSFANLLGLLDPAAATGPAAPNPDGSKTGAPKSGAPKSGAPKAEPPTDAATATTAPAVDAMAAALALPAMLVVPAAPAPPPAPAPPAGSGAVSASGSGAASPAGSASPTPVAPLPTRRAPITSTDAAGSHPEPATSEAPPTPPAAVAPPAVTIPAAPAASVVPATPVSYASTVPGVPQPALSGALGRLRHGPDGVHEIEIALHPADLGSVQVRVTISHGNLDVTVACADQGARDAVSAALPSLRHDLAGLQNVDLTSTRPTLPAHGPVSTSPSDRPAGDGSDQHRGDPRADPHDQTGQHDQRRGRHRPDDDFDRWM